MENKQIKQMYKILFQTFIILFFCSCNDIGTPIDIPQKDMTLRQIVGQNFQNTNFCIGTRIQTSYKANSIFYPIYTAEFKCAAPDSVFSQAVVYPILGGSWWGDGYRNFFTDARLQNHYLKANASISSECSANVKKDNISKVDLDALMTHYLSILGQEIETNKDVVSWMEVVSDPIVANEVKGLGYSRESATNTIIYPVGSFLGPRVGTADIESPWAYLGFDTIIIDNSSFVLPKYISKAFILANRFAPNVKKLFVQDMDNMNSTVLDKLKGSILALRAQDIKVDGIGWKGIVSLGWELNAQNIQQLSSFIDWCKQNSIEFYITSLEVKVSDYPNDYDLLASTSDAQANTLDAITQLMVSKAGNGATGIWFGLFTGESVNGKTYGNLFDLKGVKTPAYNLVKSTLLTKYRVLIKLNYY